VNEQAPTTPPPMGDNKGPAFNPDVVAALTKDADHISEKAGEFSEKEITNDTEAGELKDFLDAARKTLTHVENRRTAEKKPFLDAGREIDAAFAKIKDVIERAGKLAKAPLVTYLEEQERIAEAKRREEAEAARKKQEEAERERLIAERNANAAAQVEAEEKAKEAEEQAKAAEAPAKAKVTSATGSGANATSLRTKRTAEITNMNMALLHFRDRSELKDCLIRLANADIRASKGADITIPGIKINVEKVL